MRLLRDEETMTRNKRRGKCVGWALKKPDGSLELLPFKEKSRFRFGKFVQVEIRELPKPRKA